MTPEVRAIAQRLADAIEGCKSEQSQPARATRPAAPIVGWPAERLNREEIAIAREGMRRVREFCASRHYAQLRARARRGIA